MASVASRYPGRLRRAFGFGFAGAGSPRPSGVCIPWAARTEVVERLGDALSDGDARSAPRTGVGRLAYLLTRIPCGRAPGAGVRPVDGRLDRVRDDAAIHAYLKRRSRNLPVSTGGSADRPIVRAPCEAGVPSARCLGLEAEERLARPELGAVEPHGRSNQAHDDQGNGREAHPAR
jgi:hypothetical protein